MIKPCPFCGNPPELKVDSPCGNSRDIWARIMCGKCEVRPNVGLHRATFYYNDNYPYTPVRFRSDEEARDIVIKDVIRVWNTRSIGDTHD